MSGLIHGVGLGLRAKYFDLITTEWPAVSWFEVLADQFIYSQGILRNQLRDIHERYPMALHCVAMSLGGVDPLNQDYLKRVKDLAAELNVGFVSDHVCFVSHQGEYAFELLPLPFTQATLNHLSSRIQAVQDYVGRPLLIENVSAYFAYREQDYPEAEFLQTLCDRTGCGLLLDVNNVYVNSINQGLDPVAYFDALRPGTVKQIHLAGYSVIS